MNQTLFFDLEDIWVNELVGDIWLFFFLGVIIVWFVSLKANIPHEVAVILTAFWAAICFAIAMEAMLIVWILVVAGIGFMFYYNVSKALKRG